MALAIFPSTLKGLVYPVTRSPSWHTDMMRSVTGKKAAYQNYSYPIYKYEIGYSFLRADSVNLEWQTLMTFYNRVGGPANPWKFDDPTDDSVTDQSLGTGDGVTTAFQLVRTMTGLGANVFVEPVWAPNTITNVKVNGIVTPAYTLDDTGGITFTAAPANGVTITWTGTYYWICRFTDDMIDFENFAYHFWSLSKLVFESEKL